MKRVLIPTMAIVLACTLAGCGVDGAPERPDAPGAPNTRGDAGEAPGITVSATAETGVRGGSAP